MNRVASPSLTEKISGMFLVDKPSGLTSHDVVARVRKELGFTRVGHGGTLDPMATGVLPVFVGKSTRLSELIHGYDKTYRFDVLFGIRTDTGDAEGRPISFKEFDRLDSVRLESLLSEFTGVRFQKPPMYSAVKKNGTPLYRLARKGIEVERESRRIEIHSLELTGYPAEGKIASFRMRCSKGTFVRTIAEEIGEAMGLGGHVVSLRREEFGRFRIQDAVSLPDLISGETENGFHSYLWSPAEILESLPEIRILDVHLPDIHRGALLLAFQIYRTSGLFNLSEIVRISDRKGKCIAVGKASVSSSELDRLPKGLPVARIDKLVDGL
ncbi:MAG: tRNA pseudouridine(55) synthase TruB [Nitrospirae bacterium]|jgi:tRNA pseudouridine55 synthase|nr:tRNA pseudouridine(55) synthase TruB [Nitrospirota bacterium]